MLMIMRDILLSSDLAETETISVNMQNKLLYTINYWVINDGMSICAEDLTTVFVFVSLLSVASCRFCARSPPSFTPQLPSFFSKSPHAFFSSSTISTAAAVAARPSP